jgi:trans-aconitate methyltransferase
MAAAYDLRIDAILPQSDLFFSQCLSYIPAGQPHLLELGSGTGYATAKILAEHPEATITCLDHSDEMIQCAREKPELSSVEMVKQDIRDAWPAKCYDGMISTLCLHHIPLTDRAVVFQRIYESLSPGGVFICGDIIRSESVREEEIYRGRWTATMRKAGMSEEEIHQIVQSREANYADMETIHSLPDQLNAIGFSPVFIPYRYELSAVFVGYKNREK